MTVPGFTATAALGRPNGRYATGPTTRGSGLPETGRLEALSACGTCQCARGQCCSDSWLGCECSSCGSTVPPL